ncbi:MAG: hypothetical protein HY271_18880 [Deltaproteobacteria bacterium]|nr:hypothetical protein [Deltaproteobacteria bacterium]
MRPICYASLVSILVIAASLGTVRADELQIAPGTGLQSSVVINTGPDGICNTTAALGDIQAATVGQGTPFRTEIRCGANKLVETAAGGDDVQLIAVGGTCQNTNKPIIDTGPNGVPDSVPAGDDVYAGGIVFGVPPANTPCVIAGADGVAQTAAPAGDDVQVLAAGVAAPNTAVVLCGPNGVADTTANNVNLAGDDVQVVLVGNACSPNDVVVDSGPNGIADTRAEGPDLGLGVVKPIKLHISSGFSTGTKLVKLKVLNVEFGAMAPASRAYKLTATNGSCPGGTVTQLDADASTPGLQATANVLFGGKIKATFVVTAHLEDVTSTGQSPFRCTFNVSAVALDTAPNVDDGANPENNTTTVDLEITDRNDP